MTSPKLSVCILTHKRPALFARCLESVLRVCPGAEVLVNNDSRDIEPDGRAQYFFNAGPLNTLYQTLFEHSTGSHIWFLEDDDVALRAPVLSRTMTVHRYINHDNEIIGPQLDGSEFQLSQCCIPRSDLDFSAIERQCNCIFNDWHLVRHVPHINVPSAIFRQFYVGDNISFPESPNFKGGEKCYNCRWLPEQMKLEIKHLEP